MKTGVFIVLALAVVSGCVKQESAAPETTTLHTESVPAGLSRSMLADRLGEMNYSMYGLDESFLGGFGYIMLLGIDVSGRSLLDDERILDCFLLMHDVNENKDHYIIEAHTPEHAAFFLTGGDDLRALAADNISAVEWRLRSKNTTMEFYIRYGEGLTGGDWTIESTAI